MARVKAPAAEEMLEYAVDGATVKVMSRLADNNQLARLFALEPNATRSDTSLLTDEDVAVVARRPIGPAARKGRTLHALGVMPGTAKASPRDPRIALLQVGPLSFSLPGAPDGLAFQMDERGNGSLHALGDDRMRLGSNGMWWIVTRIIEALEDPQTVSCWPRFLTVAGGLGAPATQASLQYSDTGICLAWRRLQSGVVGDVLAWQELSHERAQGWLSMLQPVLLELEQRRVHRQQLLPARTAERWARAVERWTA
jgi:hypothetical protein